MTSLDAGSSQSRDTSTSMRRYVVPVVAALALFASLFLWWKPEDESGAGGGLLLFALINFNIVLLCVLAFVIGRNVLRLIFDRRRNILGSALKLRLVFAFVMLTLVPAVILFIFASGLISRVMEGWFSSPVETAVEGALEVARENFSEMKESARNASSRITDSLEERWSVRLDRKGLEDFLERERRLHGLFALKVLDRKGVVLFEVKNAAAMVEQFREPDPDAESVSEALSSEVSVISRERDGGQFIEVYRPLIIESASHVLLAVDRVNPELFRALGTVSDARQEYEQLKLVRGNLRSGYLLMLAMITGSILFAAIWTGFYIARIIVVPLERLAEGTRRVAGGDYSFKIEQPGDDEIGLLVGSFNRMTEDLRQARDISESRRLFLETVLNKLAVGVIAIDRGGLVTSLNGAAGRIFEINDTAEASGKELRGLLGSAIYEQVSELLGALISGVESGGGAEEVSERQFSVFSRGRELKIVCTAGLIPDPHGHTLGAVLLFDDITELAKAESMAVWREVARRIAHEIKNPLTPIQLSAQRLQKLFEGEGGNPTVKEGLQTIVDNVDSIKRLANEFSNFARMPTAEFQAASLNMILSETIALYAGSNPDVIFQFIADNKMPEIRLDPEQIRRVVINLIDNAVDAVQRQREVKADFEPPRIVVRSFYDRKRRMASFEVGDNGPGVSAAEKARIFEPYFTTKKRGTGLGLAIVTSILSDHQGTIKVYDNTPRGAKFVIEIPLARREQVQRRLASA